MKYDAFISYKHEKLDMEVAKKLHSALETYHIPKAVQKKTGKKKIERVFRDEEELPIGSDLNEKILTALKNSKYLIVICSGKTSESYWVNKEIDTFISLHGRKKILAVLIDGEPENSFPVQLLQDDKGNPIEPLAADIRGNSKKERNKKFKTEIIRLLAPLIGCSYDDLKQRHRERLIKQNIAVGMGLASVIAIAGLAFGIYNRGVADKMKKLANEKDALASEKTTLAAEKTELAAEKTELAAEKTELANNILAEYKQKLENQSRFYAEKSLSVLEEGNRRDAALIAMEGLPREGDERPYVPEAEYALSEALHAYDCGENLASDALLEHRYSVVKQKTTFKGDKLITIDQGDYVYVWDTEFWEIIIEISPDLGDNNYIESISSACADDSGIYVGAKNSVYQFDYDGILQKTCTFSDTIQWLEMIPGTNKLLVVAKNIISVVDGESLEVLYSYENTNGNTFTSEVCVSPDGGMIAIPDCSDDEKKPGYVNLFDCQTFEVKTVKAFQNFIMRVYMPDDEHLCILSSDYDPAISDLCDFTLDYIDALSGKKLLSKMIPFTILWKKSVDSFIGIQKYLEDDQNRIQIVVIVGEEEYTLDAETGETLAYMTLSGIPTCLIADPDVYIGFIGYENGVIDTVDFNSGRVNSDYKISTGIEISDMIILDEQLTINSNSSELIHVLNYHKASDLEELTSLFDDISLYDVNKNDNCFIAKDSEFDDTYYLLNGSGEQIYTIEKNDFVLLSGTFYKNSFIGLGDGAIREIDYEKNNVVSYSLNDLGYDGAGTMTVFSESGRYLCIHGIFDIAVFDMEDMKMLYRKNSDNTVEAVAVSDTGDYLYVSYVGQNLTKIDIKSGKEISYNDDSLRQATVLNGYDRMKLSPDGKKLAMYCMDETMKIINTDDGSVIVSFDYISKTRFFVGFIDESNKIIVQGEDNNITIIDLKYKELIRSVNIYTSVICMVEDKNGHIALFDGNNTYLLDSKSFGVVAIVPKAVVYLKEDSSFILETNRKLYKCYYKNYKVLIAEADRQFPEAELDSLKRSQYNIG